jgi:hypothetical protein
MNFEITGQPPRPSPSPRQWLWIAVLACAAAAPYLPALRYGFVYDDRPQIVENQDLLSLRNIPGFFAQSISKSVGFHNSAQPVFYRPLFFSQLCLTRVFLGPSPFGFHLASLLFHIGNTLLLCFTAARLGVRRPVAWLAAILFAVHPVHVESVVWPSASPDLMVLTGILCSLLFFMNGESSSGYARYAWRALSLLAFLAALFVKETALIALPLLAVVSYFAHANKPGAVRRTAVSLALYFAATLAYLAVRTHVLHGMVATISPASWLDMLRTWPRLVWFYERHLVLPIHTSLLYDYDLVEHATLAAFWIPLAAVLATVALSSWLFIRIRSIAVLVAALLLVLPILLVLDLHVFYWRDLVHDRYLYVPSAGFCMLAAIGLAELSRRFAQTISPVAQQLLVVALLCGLAMTTVAEEQPWKNNLLLLANAAEVAPGNIAAQLMLGDELEARQRFVEAGICYQRAIALTPRWAPAWFAYGRALLLGDNPAAATESLQRAVQLDSSPMPKVWLALALEKNGRHEEASRTLGAAVAQDPSMRQAYVNVQARLIPAIHNESYGQSPQEAAK